jgi:hypothetical protein
MCSPGGAWPTFDPNGSDVMIKAAADAASNPDFHMKSAEQSMLKTC